MKPSATFIMSFIATVLGFSPYAVAKHIAFPENAAQGKHCELLNKPDTSPLTKAAIKNPKTIVVPVRKAH